MALTREQYENYSESFVKPVGTISAVTMIIAWLGQWLPHVPNPTRVEDFVVFAVIIVYIFASYVGSGHQQLRLAAITSLGAVSAVALSDPEAPHSSTIAYLVLEVVVIGAVQLSRRWWAFSVAVIWVAWCVELWHAGVDSLYPQITTSIPLLVGTALSAYLSRRLHTRALSAIVIHQQAVDDASTDALTGLLNRRGFRTHVQAQETFAATFIDVNGLKKINDTYGHEAGDKAIMSVARAIREETRPEDIVCRWGGDEFVIVTTSENTPPADKIASRINTWLVDNTDEEYLISVSAGQSHLDKHQTIAELIDVADENMYARRAEQRGQIRTPPASPVEP